MRRAALLLASLATPLMALAQAGGDVGARIAGSAAAAQSLQGPLDGTWTLTDARGRTLFLFQLVDPASGDGALQVAWRRGETLGVAQAVRRGDRLSLTLRDHGEFVRVVLHPYAASRWRGALVRGGRRLAVSLTRGKNSLR
jgi:hypothetical protein